jgi:O-acetyl-ADP-ribose deacetylase (regulator of RNase III)
VFYNSINFVSGDILDFSAHRDTSCTVIPVNCEGVMGKGLALQFKNKYPDLFAEYKNHCDSGDLRIGTVTTSVVNGAWYYYFPTKNIYKESSNIDYIAQGLAAMALKSYILGPIAFPKLGCGLGGLQWEHVLPVMLFYLDKMHATSYIYL